MNQLANELTTKIERKRVTHKRAQELRRRIIKASSSLTVYGDFFLDLDLAYLDVESLAYIAALFIGNREPKPLAYYLNTTLKGQPDYIYSRVLELISKNSQEMLSYKSLRVHYSIA